MEEKRPSIFIATPMYGGQCSGHYVHGLITNIQKLREHGVSTAWCHLMNESLITRGRNALVDTFMGTTHDYLMFIDADIHFDSEAIAQLLLVDDDIVCGIYPKKEVDWKNVAKAAANGATDLQDYAGAFVFNMVGTEHAETDERGVIEVRHGGTGFMLIKRGVFEHLAPHVPEYRSSNAVDDNGEYYAPLVKEYFTTSIDEHGVLLSEDYHFCDLWRKHGGKIYAHPFIKLSHVGTYVFGGDILKSGGNLK